MTTQTRTHTHKAIEIRTRPWHHCVTPDACAANYERQAAHGNVIYERVCRCGAIRLVESNGGRENGGRWER